MILVFERLANLYREGGVQSVFDGVRRFGHWRKLAAIRFFSRRFGSRLQILPTETHLRAPVFIIGCPRSGTSIFTRSLATHPDVAEWSEAGEIWDPNYDDPSVDHVWTPDDVSESDRRRIHDTFITYTRLRRKRRFVNKHSRKTIRIEYIRELFPDAYFIHIIRHPVGPVDSMMRRSKQGDRASRPYGGFVKPPGWQEDMEKDELTQFGLSWKKLNELVLKHQDSRLNIISYESLCANPAKKLNEVCEFVGIDPVFRPERIAEEVTNYNNKSMENLGPERVDQLWSVVEETATTFDYQKYPEATQ